MTGTLFDGLPNVRASDPETSRAAASLDRSSLKARVEAALLAVPGGLTDWELVDALGEKDRRKGSITKRRQELGAVDTGERRPSRDGLPTIVWRL
jgi:hypothetical protein